jgi:hypothetical protein
MIQSARQEHTKQVKVTVITVYNLAGVRGIIGSFHPTHETYRLEAMAVLVWIYLVFEKISGSNCSIISEQLTRTVTGLKMTVFWDVARVVWW